MVKVKDLIKNSKFIKAKGFDKLIPKVTVTLPTFRRGDNGLFKFCVESILNQTFTDFELIIIDDASTDSTFSQIEEFMKKDSRVSVIRHGKNVGLPAISELEAFLAARSDKFFYAFDDNEFKPDAIETLYNYMTSNENVKIVFGIAETVTQQGRYPVGHQKFDYNILQRGNYIPNAPMLIDKAVIEDVGYYDPHVMITRLCDWDLWLRIGKKYHLHNVEKVLNIEKGVSEADSLGNSYPVNWEAVYEWALNVDRNEKLKPENILDYEVDFKPSEISLKARNVINTILETKFSKYFWYTPPEAEEFQNTDTKTIQVIVNEKCAATGFVFETLPKNLRGIVEIKTYQEFYQDIKNNFLRAKAFIFSRDISILTISIGDACKGFKIPYYYYSDDNLFELGFIPMTNQVINFLKSAHGCILSSNALIDYYKENNLNDTFYLVAPAISEELKQELKIDLNKYNSPKQINFLYASNDRLDGFFKLSDIFIKLAKEYSVKVFIFKRRGVKDIQFAEFENLCLENNISIEYLEFCIDYNIFIKTIAKLNIHFVLHPQSDCKEFKINHKYKTLNFLINAYLSSSLIFVPDIEPYSKLSTENEINNLLYNTADKVYAKIKSILKDPEIAKNIFNELEKYCLNNFSPEINEKVIINIIKSLNKPEELYVGYNSTLFEPV